MRKGRLIIAMVVMLVAGWLPMASHGAESLEVVRMELAEGQIAPGAQQLLQITLGNTSPRAIKAGLRVELRNGQQRRIGAAMTRKLTLGAKDEERVFFRFKAPTITGEYSMKFELFTQDFKRKLLAGHPVYFTPFIVGRPARKPDGKPAQQARIGAPGFLPPAGLSFELPDLLWENLKINPPGLLLGEKLRIRGDLRNVGGDVARDIVVRVDYFNTRTPGRLTSVSKSDIKILAPGEKLELEFEIEMPDNALLGEYKVQLDADVGDRVEESDEENNKVATAPIRLSQIKLVFPEPAYSFDETGLFLFRWDTLRYNEFKVQVGSDPSFSEKGDFFDIPQGEKWTQDKEIVPLEGELPAMAVGLMDKSGSKRLYWRVIGRQHDTGKLGYSSSSPFVIKPEQKEPEPPEAPQDSGNGAETPQSPSPQRTQGPQPVGPSS